MFTGIIEATAKVLKRTDHTLVIERPKIFDDITIGSSICVTGVCLSVVEMNNISMSFDVVQETWKKTKLATLEEGDRVNLERAVRADSRLDGHIVQGHVEGVGIVARYSLLATEARNQKPETRNETESIIVIDIPFNLRDYVVPKSSIAIDGVSLTIASIEQNLCTIALIPLTIRSTTLGSLKPGVRVNVETDIMLKRT